MMRVASAEFVLWQKHPESAIFGTAADWWWGWSSVVVLRDSYSYLGSESTVCDTGFDNSDGDSNVRQRLRVECANTAECGVGGERERIILLLLLIFAWYELIILRDLLVAQNSVTLHNPPNKLLKVLC